MLSDDEVTWAYRLFLDRDPESHDVLARFKRLENTKRLRSVFLSSPECRSKTLVPHLPIDVSPMTVEWRADAETSRALLSRVQDIWTRLGRERPHWSVLNSDQFLPERMRAEREAFYASGRDDVQLILATLQRLGLSPKQFPKGFEFGCGLARVTPHLARHFASVTACDVSRSHLEHAELAVAESGVGNIRLLRAALPDFGMSEPFDFWFSRIVLQHNSPPLIAMILQRALQMLLPGGLAVFQVPTYAVGYHFRIRDYLNSPPPLNSFEMHCLPQQAILEIAREQGCSVLEIREDNSAGNSNWISNWLALQKNQGVTAEAAEPQAHSAGTARRLTSNNPRHERTQPSVPGQVS